MFCYVRTLRGLQVFIELLLTYIARLPNFANFLNFIFLVKFGNRAV